jgi:hypothetical protein
MLQSNDVDRDNVYISQSTLGPDAGCICAPFYGILNTTSSITSVMTVFAYESVDCN